MNCHSRQPRQRGHYPQPGTQLHNKPQPQPHLQQQPGTHPPRHNQQTNNRTDSQHLSNKKTIKVMQLNINGLTSKIDELKELLDRPNMDIDVITLQETKLKKTSKTPKIPYFTAVRKDRPHRTGGGLMTYIKNDIIFTDIKIPQNINQHLAELQHIKIHLTKHKALNIHNVYTPPSTRDTTNPDHNNADTYITNCMTYILNSERTIVTGDFNAHHRMWCSPMTDHRGILIADKINNSDHLTLNTDSHTRHPTSRNQQPTSPDISTVTTTIHNNITGTTLDAINLNSDHKPIAILYKTKTKFRLTQNRLSYTDYKKADWTSLRIEGLLNANEIQDAHTGNKILTNLILEADKHNIPKGKQRQHKKYTTR